LLNFLFYKIISKTSVKLLIEDLDLGVKISDKLTKINGMFREKLKF